MAVQRERRAAGIGTALIEKLVADERRAGTQLLLVMTSGDADEYVPTRARSTAPVASYLRRPSLVGGRATCLCFWSDLCSLGDTYVDAPVSAGGRSRPQLRQPVCAGSATTRCRSRES